VAAGRQRHNRPTRRNKLYKLDMMLDMTTENGRGKVTDSAALIDIQ